MIKGISLLCKSKNIILFFWYNSHRTNMIGILNKFFNKSSQNTYFRVGNQHFNFFLTSIRSANIIRVHAGDEVVFALSDTEVQGFTKAAIFQKTADIQARPELQRHVGDDGIQFRRQWAITDEDEVVSRDGLVINTLHALPQVIGMLFVVDRH